MLLNGLIGSLVFVLSGVRLLSRSIYSPNPSVSCVRPRCIKFEFAVEVFSSLIVTLGIDLRLGSELLAGLYLFEKGSEFES